LSIVEILRFGKSERGMMVLEAVAISGGKDGLLFSYAVSEFIGDS